MAKSNKLIRGKDWHAWAWKCGEGNGTIDALMWAAGNKMPAGCDWVHPVNESQVDTATDTHMRCHCPGGKYVRVKFVEVKPKKGAKR